MWEILNDVRKEASVELSPYKDMGIGLPKALTLLTA